jgi:hypothetical protein
MDMSRSSYDKVDNVRFEDMGEIKLPKNAGMLTLYRLCKREEAPTRPIGIIHPSINYTIQAPLNFNNKSDELKVKPVEKTIEQRLLENSNKKITSEEKLNKLASVLKKDEKIIRKKELNFIQTLIQDLKTNSSSQDLMEGSPFLIAILVFVIAVSTNFILETEFTKNLFNWVGSYLNSILLNIPILKYLMPKFMVNINPWMWLRGFIISSFIVGQIVTQMQKKVIKFKNIVIASLLIVIFYLSLYVLPNRSAPSSLTFMPNFYINILLLWLVCTIGFFQGIEYAGDKINTSTHNK